MHPEIEAVLNLQEVRGQSEPHQVRQFIRLVQRYDLRPEDHT